MLCIFSAWFCPCVQMFRWFCPSTFFFARHQHDTLSSLPPETRDVAARDSGGEWDACGLRQTEWAWKRGHALSSLSALATRRGEPAKFCTNFTDFTMLSRTALRIQAASQAIRNFSVSCQVISLHFNGDFRAE